MSIWLLIAIPLGIALAMLLGGLIGVAVVAWTIRRVIGGRFW